MKRLIFPFLIVLVLTWSSLLLLAQGKGKGKGRGRAVKQRQTKEVEEKGADKDKKARTVRDDTGRGRRGRRLKRRAVEKSLGRGKRKVAEKDTAKLKGREHQQQIKALEKQMLHELAKHRKRAARLQRILALAKEQGSTGTVARVNKLLERERQRYDRKARRMQQRKQKALGIAEKSLSEKSHKAKKKGPHKVTPRVRGQNKARTKIEKKNRR